MIYTREVLTNFTAARFYLLKVNHHYIQVKDQVKVVILVNNMNMPPKAQAREGFSLSRLPNKSGSKNLVSIDHEGASEENLRIFTLNNLTIFRK